MTPNQIGYLQLVAAHQAALHGYIRSLAPGADADDILQETNIHLWQHSGDFEPGSHFKAYAFRIAHLKTLEALRRHRRKNWLVFDSDLLQAIAERQTVDIDSTGADSQAALRLCLAELDETGRELLHRRYTLQETVRDIARRSQRSEGSLQQLFFRLRNQLRSCIERRESLEGGGT